MQKGLVQEFKPALRKSSDGTLYKSCYHILGLYVAIRKEFGRYTNHVIIFLEYTPGRVDYICSFFRETISVG